MYTSRRRSNPSRRQEVEHARGGVDAGDVAHAAGGGRCGPAGRWPWPVAVAAHGLVWTLDQVRD